MSLLCVCVVCDCSFAAFTRVLLLFDMCFGVAYVRGISYIYIYIYIYIHTHTLIYHIIVYYIIALCYYLSACNRIKYATVYMNSVHGIFCMRY